MSALRAAGLLTLALTAVVSAQSGYTPQRVFDTARGQFSDFEVMLADLARADVVFVGEQHADANTHRLELAVLEGLAHRRDHGVLAMEMFERDVQDALDRFAAGQLPEDDFLKVSRPWPRYRTDYKPLVDFAIAHQWPVVGSNVPRIIASLVSKSGLEALKKEPDYEKRLFAEDLHCPIDDDYFKRFTEAMGDHPPTGAEGGSATEAMQRFYFAQCLKDETMAESTARAWQNGQGAGTQPIIVHVNGDFHSDYREGTAARTIRRLPGRRIAVVSILPVEDLDRLTPTADDKQRGDYLVFTVR